MAPKCLGLRSLSRSLQLSLAKVRLMLLVKHSVKLRRYLLCGGVAACPGMACVLCAVQSTAHSTHVILGHAVLCCAVPVGNVSCILFQEGRNSNFS